MPKPAWVVKRLQLSTMVPKGNDATSYWQILLPWRFTHLTTFFSEAANKPICRGTKELLPIDEKEFLTVSKLVRGRAKLHDVNKVYMYVYKWNYKRYIYLNCREGYEDMIDHYRYTHNLSLKAGVKCEPEKNMCCP